MKWVITLPKRAGGDLAQDLEKQAVYVAQGIRSLRVAGDGLTAQIDADDDASRADIEEKVTRYVGAMIARFRPLPQKVHHKRDRLENGPIVSDAFDQLVKRGWAIPLGTGQVGLAGPALAFSRALDERFRTIAMEGWQADEAAYPALIPTDVLARCGYFSSFPHTVSMVMHAVEDFDKIEAFRRANADSTTFVRPPEDTIASPETCLPPAVCYHTYQSLQGSSVGAGRVFTSVGSCYRYESKNLEGLSRLWNFSMREIVFVGPSAWVTEERPRSMARVAALIESLDLGATIETANDPFFSAEYPQKAYWQMQGELKLEIRMPVWQTETGALHTIAVGSFNLHGDFFGKTFSIRTAEDAEAPAAFTGCTAFGIERWVLAAFSQHGLDPERWPEAWRSVVFGARG